MSKIIGVQSESEYRGIERRITERRAGQIMREFRANQALQQIREALIEEMDDLGHFREIVYEVIGEYFSEDHITKT